MKSKMKDCMKKGGAVKGIAKMDKKMKAPIKKMGAKKEMKVEGKESMKRMDKFARGGKVKKMADGGRPNAEGMSADSPMSTAAVHRKFPGIKQKDE